jgi:16S rRNA (guanine(966)-N(2))-methyltransferase RsmD
MRVVGGKLKGRRITPPIKLKARPTTDMAKEALFNVLENITEMHGASVLDLFFGSGGISLEFWSRGAAEVVAVDVDPISKGFLEKIVIDWQVDGIRVVKADIFKMLKNAQRSFDIVFADPPFADPRFPVLPDTIIEGKWIKPGGWLIVEHNDAHDFQKHKYFHSHKKYGSVNFSFFHFVA